MKLEPSRLSPAIRRTIVSALEITDLIALTMVFATALSAYATWRTEQVTNQASLISQRPYIGLESIKLVGNTNPKVVEDLRNFGTVQAEQTRVSIVLRANGDALSGDSDHQQQYAPLVFSPGVPHRFYRHITSDTYRGAVQGKVNLVSETQVRYKGPLGDEHCYLTVYRYDHADGVFCPQRGSLSCDQQTDRVPARLYVQSDTSQTGLVPSPAISANRVPPRSIRFRNNRME